MNTQCFINNRIYALLAALLSFSNKNTEHWIIPFFKIIKFSPPASEPVWKNDHARLHLTSQLQNSRWFLHFLILVTLHGSWCTWIHTYWSPALCCALFMIQKWQKCPSELSTGLWPQTQLWFSPIQDWIQYVSEEQQKQNKKMAT